MSILSHQILFSPTDIQLNSTQLRLLFYMYQLSLLKGYMYACVRSVTHHRGFQSMSVPGCVCHTGSTCSLLLTNVTSSTLAGQQTTQLLFIPAAALTLYDKQSRDRKHCSGQILCNSMSFHGSKLSLATPPPLCYIYKGLCSSSWGTELAVETALWKE